MSWDIIFRYKDRKFYNNYAHFIEFLKLNTIPKTQLNKIDDFGYTLLHYSAMKSNIEPECVDILLQYGADPYIASKNEGLTPFEHALLKGNIHKMKMFIKHGYNINSKDQLGFELEHKIKDEINTHPNFYSETINYLESINLNIKKIISAKPITKTLPLKGNEKNFNVNNVLPNDIKTFIQNKEYSYASLKLRTELENKIYHKVEQYIGEDLKAIIHRKKLHELIYDCFNLGLIDYDTKEFFINSKRILNHFCHSGNDSDSIVKKFYIKVT